MNHEAIGQYYHPSLHSKVAKLVATLRATLERTQSAIEKRTYSWLRNVIDWSGRRRSSASSANIPDCE